MSQILLSKCFGTYYSWANDVTNLWAPRLLKTGLQADVTKLAMSRARVGDGQLGVFIWRRWLDGERRRESGCQRGRWQRQFLSSGATCGLWCAIVTGHFSPFHVILSPIVCFLPIDLLRLILLKVIQFLCSLMLLLYAFLFVFSACYLFPISFNLPMCLCHLIYLHYQLSPALFYKF